MSGFLGLDLSLKNTGMCYIADSWNGTIEAVVYDDVNTKPVQGKCLGDREKAHAEMYRRRVIANEICHFLDRIDDKPKHAFVEAYAFSFASNRRNSGSASVTRLAELGGVVKDWLWEKNRLSLVPIPSSAARKIVVGTLKRGEVKDQVASKLALHGFVFPSMDIMDAFVIAYAGHCMTHHVDSMFQKGE